MKHADLRRIGRPVISSNLALLRAALRHLRAPLPLPGPGRLMRLAPEAVAAPHSLERTD